MEKYIIGIDFGTTNCTMAFVSKDDDKRSITQFSILQTITAGTSGENFSLPSFIYFPLKDELSKKITALEWDADRDYVLGIFAQQRGGEIPARMVASAKSWLCHSGIDRRSNILPYNIEEEIEKISPLDACAMFLRHLKEAWDFKNPDAPFVEQQILITVPASFDPSARQLVQEGAQLASFPDIILLEEPQAAFYSWLHTHEKDWNKQLVVGDTILVVDIGGGTTDFSLISVEDNAGNIGLKRIAVGDHLLLGGDNLDMSLAYLAQEKMQEQGHSIDEWQFQSLIHACRQGKEKLLSDKPSKHVDITILGRTSKLIGGMLKTKITFDEVSALLLDGFFPLIEPQEKSIADKSAGLQQIGLPYSQDPRITGQLAKFLANNITKEEGSDSLLMPTKLLFNGGTLKSELFCNRILDLLNKWAGNLGKEEVQLLPCPDLDFAVSRGAVYYGLARNGHAIKIKSGTSRSYFIGVEDAIPAIPGRPSSLKAICVVPFGMEEGTEKELSQQEFALTLGQPATFRFFSQANPLLNNGIAAEVGVSLKNWQNELLELHPIETQLDKKSDDGKSVCVKLKSRVTELGVLELWCNANDGRKWKLEFDIRHE